MRANSAASVFLVVNTNRKAGPGARHCEEDALLFFHRATVDLKAHGFGTIHGQPSGSPIPCIVECAARPAFFLALSSS